MLTSHSIGLHMIRLVRTNMREDKKVDKRYQKFFSFSSSGHFIISDQGDKMCRTITIFQFLSYQGFLEYQSVPYFLGRKQFPLIFFVCSLFSFLSSLEGNLLSPSSLAIFMISSWNQGILLEAYLWLQAGFWVSLPLNSDREPHKREC